jgi:inosose dehydratase
MSTARTVQLGIAPIAWSNDDLPQLGGDTPLETCLSESRAAGFSGTETGGKFPLDPAVLGPILKKHELKLVSGWFSGGLLEHSVEREIERLERQLATFAALGAPVMVYAETTGTVQNQQKIPVSQRPRIAARDFAAYGRKLTQVAEHLQRRGVPMAYHHHMGTIVENEIEIDLLMANSGPAVGLLIDTGHLTYAGGDVLSVTKRYASRVSHVHCKDVRRDVLTRARVEDLSFLDAVLAGVFTVPGDGCIDFAAFARVLAEIGYNGWAVVEAEQDPVKAPPLEYARIGHDDLTRAFGAAGYSILQ